MKIHLLFAGGVDPGHFVHRSAHAMQLNAAIRSLRLLFAGAHDWAHTRHRIASALRACAVEAHALTVHAHPFGYARDLTPADLGRITALDWLATTGDEDWATFDELRAQLPEPRYGIVAVHSGSRFRSRHWEHLEECHRRGVRAHFYGCDLIRFHDGRTPAFPAIVPAVKRFEAPTYEKPPLRVAHSPTNRYKKGTGFILRACEGLAGIELDLIEGLSHAECMERRARAHVVIDQMQPKIGGFGTTSVEALAQGQIAIADMRHCGPVCWKHIDRPPIYDLRNENELANALRMLRDSPSLVARQRALGARWVASTGAPETVAGYWIDKLEGLR